MGIRIDPSLEFVWRDPHTVQVGVDPPRAVIAVPTAADERFLSALRRETSREALPAIAEQAGSPPAEAAAVLGAVAPALIDVLPEPLSRVEVHGRGSVAVLLADLLLREGVTVVRTTAPLGGPVPLPDPPPQLAVVVADHVVDPALRSAWIRRDVPHLPVVVGDGRVRIGPLLEPAAGPCLHCLELARTDEDPGWPTIASQVWGRPASVPSSLLAAAVAVTACRLLLDRLPRTGAVPPTGEQFLLNRDDLALRSRTIRPHPRCACRALPGNGSHAVRPLVSSRDATR